MDLNLDIQVTILILGDVPRVTSLVDILGVPTDCDGRTLSDTSVDGEHFPEGVCCDFMIG